MSCEEVVVSLDVAAAALLVLKTAANFDLDCGLSVVEMVDVVVSLVLQMDGLDLAGKLDAAS